MIYTKQFTEDGRPYMTYPEGKFCLLDGREVTIVEPWQFVSSNTISTFGATAAHVARDKLRDLVSDRRARTVKGNSSPNYSPEAPVRFWKMVNDTRQKMPPLPRTRQSPPEPFESGRNVLPGLEAWCKRNEIHP